MVTNIKKYELDRTGENPNNWVRNEKHTLTQGKIRTLILDNGHFFRDGLQIVDLVSGVELVYNHDYGLIGYNDDASMDLGKEVYGGIQIRNSDINASIAVTYRAVGGQYTDLLDLIVGFIETIENDNRSVNWLDVLGVPSKYKPDIHYHTIKDGYNFNGLLVSIRNLKDQLATINETLAGTNDPAIAKLTHDIKQVSLNLKNRLQVKLDGVSERLAKVFEKSPSDLGIVNLRNYGNAYPNHFNLKSANKYASPGNLLKYLERSSTGVQSEDTIPLWYNGITRKPGTFYSGDEKPSSTTNRLFFNGVLKAHRIQTGNGDLFSNENPPSLDDIIEAGYKFYIDQEDIDKQSSKRLFIENRPVGKFVPVEDTFMVDSDEINAYSLKRNVVVAGMTDKIKVGVSETNGVVLGATTEKPVRIVRGNRRQIRFMDHNTETTADVVGDVLNFGTYDVTNLYLNSDTSITSTVGGSLIFKEGLDGGKHAFVRIPKFTWKDVGLGDSLDTFPAFIKNGVETNHILIGQVPVSLVDGKLSTVLNKAPLSDLLVGDLETHLTNTGANFKPTNIWDSLALLLYVNTVSSLPEGNTNYGQYETNADSYGVRVDGGVVGETTGSPLTIIGSGPIDWFVNKQPDGISDLVGNVREYITGLTGNTADPTVPKYIPDGGEYLPTEYVTTGVDYNFEVDNTTNELKLNKGGVTVMTLPLSNVALDDDGKSLTMNMSADGYHVAPTNAFKSISNGVRLTYVE